MLDQVKIISIGASGSGKTCFMYAMYANMSFGSNGFTFIPSDYNQALMLEKGWESIALNAKWPEGNIESFHYSFNCNYSYKPILSFDWEDYRGSIWTEDGDSPELATLIEKLKDSDAIIVFIKAETIRGIVENDYKERELSKKDLRIIANLFDKAKKEVPVVLVLTKADMLSEEQNEEGISLLVNKYLGSLFQDNGKWPVMITSTSLGENLRGNQGGMIEGDINPVNINLPVLFTIHYRLTQIIQDNEATLENYTSELNSANKLFTKESQKSGWKKFWGGDYSETYKRSIKEIEEKLNIQGEAIRKLKEDLVRIENELNEGCLIFYSGQQFRFKQK